MGPGRRERGLEAWEEGKIYHVDDDEVNAELDEMAHVVRLGLGITILLANLTAYFVSRLRNALLKRYSDTSNSLLYDHSLDNGTGMVLSLMGKS